MKIHSREFILLTLFIFFSSTPCLAQIETESLFSIKNTCWSHKLYASTLCFSNDSICFCFEGKDCNCSQSAFILDLVVISFFGAVSEGSSVNGIANPFLGVGFFIACAGGDCESSDMTKISDDWTPPGD